MAYIRTTRAQTTALVLLAACAVGMAGALSLAGSTAFQFIFGTLHPVAVLTAAAIPGTGVMLLLASRTEFQISRDAASPRALALTCGLPVPFAAVVVLIDLVVVFPRGLNVAFPQSLLFYPAIGYFVEMVFHVLPLSLFLLIARGVFRARGGAVWVAGILAVALLEPALQVTLVGSALPAWVTAYVVVHVFAFNVAELLLFRQYGFVSMLLLRLVYYFLWHVLWGHVRLSLLFS